MLKLTSIHFIWPHGLEHGTFLLVFCCAGGWRFEYRPWHCGWRSFSSSQATGKGFSTKYAIYCKSKLIGISPHDEAVNNRLYSIFNPVGL